MVFFGGDVPGLNPAIRAVTIRALREGHRVIGIRRGWGGLVDIIPDKDADNSANIQVLTEDIVDKAGRTGGTFLHSSRTRPSTLPKGLVPPHLRDRYQDEVNDITDAEVLAYLLRHDTVMGNFPGKAATDRVSLLYP